MPDWIVVSINLVSRCQTTRFQSKINSWRLGKRRQQSIRTETAGASDATLTNTTEQELSHHSDVTNHVRWSALTFTVIEHVGNTRSRHKGLLNVIQIILLYYNNNNSVLFYKSLKCRCGDWKYIYTHSNQIRCQFNTTCDSPFIPSCVEITNTHHDTCSCNTKNHNILQNLYLYYTYVWYFHWWRE